MAKSEAKVANVEQSQAWNGNEGEHWAEHAVVYDAAVRHHHARFMAAASLAANDRVLDVGCGNGQTTRDAARAAVEGTAVGVDLSAQMLQRARQLADADGLRNVTFVQADAQVHRFDEGDFTASISRFGSMFFGDPVAAFTNIAHALRPGAQLTLLSWRDLSSNEWISSFRDALAAGRTLPTPPPDAPSPFAHADPDRVRKILSASGFGEVAFEEVDEPMFFGSDAAEGYELLRGGLAWILEGLDDPARASALDALRSTLIQHDTSEGPAYDSAAWVITARRL